jgi:hypothetical protein
MTRLITVLCAGVVAIAVGSGSALRPAAAATLTPAEKTALKEAIASCKSEAKGKKIAWLKRRKYVSNCVVEALKDRPNIDVMTLLKKHPDMKELPAEQSDAM